jgi:murein DD-endopeptidase MepM/ murein hydrolase activator NlpD
MLILAIGLLVCSVAQAAVLTFEDVPGAMWGNPGYGNDNMIPNGYGGFNWLNVGVISRGTYSGSGYDSGIVSGDWVAYNSYARQAITSSSGTFDFNGAYFTSAWYSNNVLTLTGYRNGTQKYQNSWTLNLGSKPIWVSANFRGIDTLQFSTSNAQLVMDDFTYATDFVYPVLADSQTDPTQNKNNPIGAGWHGPGVGEYSATYGHLGQDYIYKSDSADKPVFAVANGVIVEVLSGPGRYGWCDDDDHGWGPVVVIEHTLPTGFKVPSGAVQDDGCGTDLNPTFIYSLYGHLSKESIKGLQVGQMVQKGDKIGTIGKFGVDQNKWSTNHLHFELKDQWAFESEGSWFFDKNNWGKCPEYTEQKCLVKGIGTGYSHAPGFAPHRYSPFYFFTSNMIRPETIVYPPKVSISVSSKKWQTYLSVMAVDLKITNTGSGIAQNTVVKNINFKTLFGTGSVTVNEALSQLRPINVGYLNVGESRVITVYLNVPSTVYRFTISENGTVQDMVDVTSIFSVGQTIIK